MIGIGALFSAVTASQYHTFSAADRASFNPVAISLSGAMFAVVAFGVLEVHGLDSEAVGEIAAQHRLTLHELTPVQVSLEEAFMELTRDSVEYHGVTAGELVGAGRSAE